MSDQNYSEPDLINDSDHELLFKAAYAQWLIQEAGPGVTSVGLSLPSIFTVTGSPVTTSGTLTGTLATQAANLVFAGPSTGADATPTFRALAASDIPAAGSNTQIQINDNGDLAGAAGATYSGGVVSLGVDGALSGQLVLFDSGGAPGTAVLHTPGGGEVVFFPVATASRTINNPDASGVMVLEDNTATLTNKTISGASNTLSNIATTSLTGVLQTAQFPTGSVLQIVAVTPKTDIASGTDLAPTWGIAYSGSITTKSASSTVVCICCAQAAVTTGFQGFLRLQRSGTPLVQGDSASNRIRTFGAVRTDAQGRTLVGITLIGSDAPGSIASHTYSLAFAVETGGTWYLNRSADDADAAYIARGATTMFLVEIA